MYYVVVHVTIMSQKMTDKTFVVINSCILEIWYHIIFVTISFCGSSKIL
jgi:hypothetical protein